MRSLASANAVDRTFESGWVVTIAPDASRVDTSEHGKEGSNVHLARWVGPSTLIGVCGERIGATDP